MPLLHLFSGFSPHSAWRHIASINVKFGTEEGTVGRLPMPNFTFIGKEVWEYNPEDVKIWDFANKFAPQERFVCTFLTKFSVIVHVHLSSF